MHGMNAVGFLDAPAADITQHARAIGKHRHGGGGHGRIGNQIEIAIESAQRFALGPARAADLDGVGVAHNRGTHFLNNIGEGHIALHAVRARAQYMDGPAAYRAQSHEIRRRRSIALDGYTSWRGIARFGGDDKTLPPFLPDLYAEPGHQIQGDGRSEEHTSELQSLMSISYAAF